jgi:hypothetical protein
MDSRSHGHGHSYMQQRVMSEYAVMSRNNRRAAGSGAWCQAVLLQWNMWYVTHINRGAVFSVVSLERLYLENRWQSRQKSRESLQADRLAWIWGCCETVAPDWGMEGRATPIVLNHCVATPSCEIVTAREDVRRGTRKLRELWRWKTTPDNQWRHSRLRGLSAFCSELQNVWISNSAIVPYSYDL